MRIIFTKAGFSWLSTASEVKQIPLGVCGYRGVKVGGFGASKLNFSFLNGLWGNAGSGMMAGIKRSCKVHQSFSLFCLVI